MARRATERVPWGTTVVLVVLSLLSSGVWAGHEPEQEPAAPLRAAPPLEGSGDPPRSLRLDPPVASGPSEASSSPPGPPAAGAVAEDRHRCRVPEVEVERTPPCDEGLPYPACKWRLPPPHRAGRTYGIWRNTVDDHLWARPALVAVMLAVAAQYARQYPGEELAIGDLDAPGPRHETHDAGVDVDLYLPGTMAIENLGGGAYAENYRDLDRLQRRMVRARVETLAQILATCTQGRLRIYYNDDAVRRRFLDWFDEQGFASPFGTPMQKHNDLHRFHFHVTVPEDLAMPAPEGSTT